MKLYTTERVIGREPTACPYCGHDPVNERGGCEHHTGYWIRPDGTEYVGFEGTVDPSTLKERR